MNKEKLKTRAEELGIKVPEGATNAEISNLIKLAEHPELVKTIKTLTENLSKIESAYKAAKNLNEELAKKLEVVVEENNSEKKPSYKLDGKEYVFEVSEFRFKGRKIFAAEAVKDQKLMEALIKASFASLKQL